MEVSGESEISTEEQLLQKHRKENKELQGSIQRLKHAVPKGDKKRKKEVTLQIAKMEAELEDKHTQEQDQLRQDLASVVNDLAATNLDGACGTDLTGLSNGPIQAADTDKKPSKAQKRRDRKAAKDREREDNIREQDIVNLSGTRHLEAQKLKSILAERGMAIFEIASDGHCLYAAVVDQLTRIGLQDSVASLRVKTADYMRQNQDDFLPFLSKADTGDPYTQEEYEDYCHKLETTPEWGGQLEIRALSNVLEQPIEVIQADGPVVLTGEEYSAKKLALSYHRHMYGMGEHYNSAVDKSLLPDAEEDDFT